MRTNVRECVDIREHCVILIMYETQHIINGATNMTKQRKPKITSSKYMGNDANSYAVFVDGRVFVSGISKREVAHYKQRAQQMIDERANAK